MREYAVTSGYRTQFDNRTEDMGEGLTDGEYFFWQTAKRNENLVHRDRGHTQFCQTCFNCKCGEPDKRFKCVCGEGKVWLTPYRLRKRANLGR